MTLGSSFAAAAKLINAVFKAGFSAVADFVASAAPLEGGLFKKIAGLGSSLLLPNLQIGHIVF